MIELVDALEFLRRQQREKLVLLDTRSPGEFAAGHIPGALSLPLFSEAERAEVGTMYKQVGPRPALLRGLELVGPKMRFLVEEATRLSQADFGLSPKSVGLAEESAPDFGLSPKPAESTFGGGAGLSPKPAMEQSSGTAVGSPKIGVYCWRGGSRSSSVAWLLETAGFAVTRLEGGYKAYRQYGRSYLDATPFNFQVVDGPTGSGKTAFLHALARKGAQVLDLEGIAKHKGSAFGLTPGDEQPSNEAAENEIIACLLRHDLNRPIWVENESRNIGKVFLPDAIVAAIARGHRVELSLPLADRLDHIVQQYGRYKRSVLAETFHHLRKRLGLEATQKAIAAVDAGDLRLAAEIALGYYDKTYAHATSRQEHSGHERHETTFSGLKALAERLTLRDDKLNKHQLSR